jgi:nicotinamidase-related amidase
MTSLPVRDRINDHLLTSKNAALVIIDYQPVQVSSIGSMDRQLLIDNIVRVAKLGKAFDLPIVLSTVNVKTGVQKGTIPPLKEVLRDNEELDRTTINAWEDSEVLTAIEATGRKKLIMCALWTEACLIFPSLDALREGYEIYPVIDSVGGVTVEGHRAALERIGLAGGKYVSWVQLACELQRDWARSETVSSFRQILFDSTSPVYKNEHREQIVYAQ